jgi:electron transfer flavoprotein beta subunit
MKAFVAIKAIVDPTTLPKLNSEGSLSAQQSLVANPLDLIALTHALALKANNQLNEVVTMSVGNSQQQQLLQETLARGADRAILIDTQLPAQQAPLPLAVAQELAALIQEEQPAVVMLGKQAVDYDYQQTGPLLAQLLGWPIATAVAAATIIPATDNNPAQMAVTCETNEGLQQLQLPLPCILTAELSLATIPYINLMAIMAAKHKPLLIRPAQLGTAANTAAAVQLESLQLRQITRTCHYVNTSDELITVLQQVTCAS